MELKNKIVFLKLLTERYSEVCENINEGIWDSENSNNRLKGLGVEIRRTMLEIEREII